MAKLYSFKNNLSMEIPAMDMITFFAKFLSPETQKVVSLLLPFLKDKEVAGDLNIVLTEIEKALAASSKNPKTDKRLKEAFNDVAQLSSVGKAYLKDGKISIFTAAKLASNKGRFKDSSRILHDAFVAQQPDTVAFSQTLKTNDAFYNAVKRLLLKTNGKLFRLEPGENGGGYAVDLMTEKCVKIPLKKEDYEEIQKALASPKNPSSPPPTP
ncbi:MAG: hypothetical protein K8R48_08855 [Alphaproteobacteria bacterium]|nr:hypothetical protein [Alphaproteobacteria bacterium]